MKGSTRFWMMKRLRRRGAAAAALALAGGVACAAAVNVVTHHNDALRTGWNSAESTLTPGVVSGGTFGLLQQVALDDQVDAEPLYVSGLSIAGGTHNVVYVATENNSVYALDAATGATLVQVNLGPPVPISQLPGGCNNNGNNIGINSTPVIDLASQTLYVMAYTSPAAGAQTFELHALSLATLADKVTPTVVTAQHTLSDGKTIYSFTPSASRQRAALLEANGNIYAGFASFCDINANLSRGWLLGWNATTLAPVSVAHLNNQVLPANSPDDFFLSSIWMSGNGPAWGGGANILFTTGNSDYSGTTYSNTNAVNLSESVVSWSTTRNTVASYFSPTDSGVDVATLDREDADFGSGGVMLLPKQPGSVPQLAVAAGKVGVMYLMNRANLGGENSQHVLGEYQIGSCWCGEAYFKGSDGVGRVVSSGGGTVNVWKVQTSPATTLVPDPSFTPGQVANGQDGGFFTSVSSKGTVAGTAVIWALGRPYDSAHDVTLYAFDATTGRFLYSAVAGSWPNTGGNANIVPMVAAGRVYVASYRSLAIFGPGAAASASGAAARFVAAQPAAAALLSAHQVSGFVRSVSGPRIVIELRDGRLITADLSQAVQRHAAIQPQPGAAVLARGELGADGVLQAESLLRAKPQQALWSADR